jgi:hypothetical protein
MELHNDTPSGFQWRRIIGCEDAAFVATANDRARRGPMAASAYSGAVLVSPSRTPYPENSRNAAQQMQQFLDCLPVLLNPPRTVDLSARGETPRAVSRREFCSGSRRRRQALNEIRAISTTRSPSKSPKRRPHGFHHGCWNIPLNIKPK